MKLSARFALLQCAPFKLVCDQPINAGKKNFNLQYYISQGFREKRERNLIKAMKY